MCNEYVGAYVLPSHVQTSNQVQMMVLMLITARLMASDLLGYTKQGDDATV
jgi:hypothetical protein